MPRVEDASNALISFPRAAWLGTRIVLQQVSPESRAIFDFILELYRSCSGDWHSLIGPDLDNENLQALLTYSATFLSNIGNYFVCLSTST